MPHRNTAAASEQSSRKRRAASVLHTGKGDDVGTSSDQQRGMPTMGGQSAHGKGKLTMTQSTSTAIPQNAALQGHRRASSQSLTLDLDGLDLGQHGSLPASNDSAARSSTAGRAMQSLLSSSLSKEASPLSGLRSPDLATETFKAHGSRVGEEDSFAVHLRDCEDAHDIPTVEAVLQYPDSRNKASNPAGLSCRPTEGTGQVLGGFASLGLVNSARSTLGLLGSDTDMTASTSSIGLSSSPVSPTQYTESLSPWTTLKLQTCDPMGIVDILSVDEMGLHSINIGSSDNWRGTDLVSAMIAEGETAAQQGGPPASTTNVAEWSVARSKARQRKWIVAPASSAPARTVVVSDHIAKAGADSLLATHHPSAFSGRSTFSLRFLQAGNRAPDCTITLATPITHRAQVAEQPQFSPAATPSLNSMSLHDEQMRGIYKIEPYSSGEDAWPSMRARAISTVAHSQGSPLMQERRLTHSKSTSTIVAANLVQIESRRPSLGKSMSHEGLLPDASPRPSDGFVGAGQQKIGSNTDFRSTSSPSPGLRQSYSLSADESAGCVLSTGLPSESSSPFGDYAIGLNPVLPVSSTAPSTTLDIGPSPRSSMHESSGRTALQPTSTPRPDGQPILSTIDPGRIAALQHFALPHVKATASLWPSSPTSSQSAGIQGKPGVRREKRLSEWLRRKVMPGHGSPQQMSPIWSPPLPPAWEPTNASSTASTNITVPPEQVSRADTAASNSKSEISSGDRRLSERVGRGSASPEQDVAKAGGAAQFPSPLQTPVASNATTPTFPGTPQVRDQRRRSNSDDVLWIQAEAERKRQAAANSETGTRKGRSASGNASLMTAAPGVFVDERDLDQVSAASIDGSVQSAISAYMRQDMPSDPYPIAPELLGLDDVPAEAMTMIIALPMGNHLDFFLAARYLRVSFVPFQVGALSSHGSEEPPTGADEGPEGSLAVPPSGSAWYRRLASAWHATPSSQGTCSDDECSLPNRSPPPGMTGATTVEQLSRPTLTTASSEKRDAFRIIAKVLANPQRSEAAEMDGVPSAYTSYTHSGTPSLPQPFSFPVILGVCDSMGRLDLIPEGWQSIGLSAGPAPAFTTVSNSSQGNSSTVSHPMRGVADLIVAGCAACMDL